MARHQHLLTRDLFTGEPRTLRLKSGDGSHVRLHRDQGERRPVAGMAYFQGTGPQTNLGTSKHQCVDCAACAHVENLKKAKLNEKREPIFDKKTRTEYACRKAWLMLDGPAPGGLRFQWACKYFEARPGKETPTDYWEKEGGLRSYKPTAAA